jgi:hypothetical protein
MPIGSRITLRSAWTCRGSTTDVRPQTWADLPSIIPRRIWKSTDWPPSMHSAKPQKFMLPSDRDSASSSASNSRLPIAVFALPDFHTPTPIAVV